MTLDDTPGGAASSRALLEMTDAARGGASSADDDRREREALLRFLAWAVDAAAALDEPEAVESLRAASRTLRRGIRR